VLKRDNQERILDLRLVGDYLLVLRESRMELHYVPPFPDAGGQLTLEYDPGFYRFYLSYPDLPFTGASMSEPQLNPGSVNVSRIIYILAHQAVVGFFYFRATIYNPDYVPLGPRTRMDINLLGVYRIGRTLATGALLGPEGKRGIWIEGPPSDPARCAVAVTFDQSCPAAIPVQSGESLEQSMKLLPRIRSTSNVLNLDHRGKSTPQTTTLR